jgi:GntR family transcriptional regulator
MIDKNEGMSFYIQIYKVLRERIETKIYPANSLMPSENELCEEFKVTRLTVRNALKKLKEEGCIYTEKGKGSFVKSRQIEQSLFKFYSFGRDYVQKGFDTETLVVSSEITNVEGRISELLELEGDDKVYKIVRLRKLDNTPALIETSFVPESLAPGIINYNLEELSIYDLLEKEYGFNISKAKEYLNPAITDNYQSKLLQIKKNTPVFVTERVSFKGEKKPVEVRVSVIRSDVFKFFVELS